MGGCHFASQAAASALRHRDHGADPATVAAVKEWIAVENPRKIRLVRPIHSLASSASPLGDDRILVLDFT